MRRTSALLAVTALAAVGLVGCTAAPDASCNPTSQFAGALEGVQVSGSGDGQPELDVRTPFHVTRTSSDVLERGDGPAIEEDNQLVVLDIAISSGSSGESVIATPYNGELTRVFPLSEWTQGFPGLATALECATEGSRLVVGLAPEDLAEGVAGSLGISEDDSAVAVVDVRKVYLPKANGADQFTESHGLPTVVRAPNGRPGIIVPDATAPSDTVVQVLKRGDGGEVGGDDAARVAYTAVSWESGDVLDSTWDAAPVAASAQSLPEPVLQALEGQTVGSQVLVVLPGADGGSAQVYVLDILGIDG
ncbi:FKBP-type peptidyl-prolyl cis-trans isomerase [Microbacterium sp. RD1]|uniref:FKBP-type peptidyl-prolyl cis-trans isomerase n=1 Tax=Microbacterium sp. RD1 TaxID=3457313 RepID=UPI003FA5571F